MGTPGNCLLAKAMRQDEKVSHFVSFCLTTAQEGDQRDRMAESGAKRRAIMASYLIEKKQGQGSPPLLGYCTLRLVVSKVSRNPLPVVSLCCSARADGDVGVPMARHWQSIGVGESIGSP